MSNLEILKEIIKEYKPETAFGNQVILKLMSKIVLPNKNGKFEIYGEPAVVKIISIEWQCVDCGRIKHEELDYYEQEEETIERVCSCGAKHIIEIGEV
jgi:hypothetical protein